jgi:squalene-associated FAD-dependent desaturase
VLRPNAGLLPVWLLQKDRRVPESRLLDYLKAWRLASAGPEATVADCLRDSGVLWERFWAPLATAVLNTPPDQASARLLWAALRESFAKGGEGCRPLVAAESLAASLVDPALRFLERHDAGIAFGRRLRGIDVGAGNRASQLRFAGETVDLGPKDQVILALPPERIGELLPRIEVPTGSHAIVNAHFKLPAPATLPEGSMLLGLVGGKAEWLFLRDGIASVTISAADRLIDEPAERLAADLWREVAAALELDGAVIPPNRIIKEKRATFAQTPEEVKRRPGAGTPWSNLRLAGDWTDTGLPATIEGAIRSGDRAAELVLAARSPG